MRNKLSIIGAVLGLILVAILVAPIFIDFNQYKDQIHTEAKKALGRDVEVKGDISLRLLPFPTVSAKEIRVANATGATDPDFLTVKKVSISVAWLPLLSKKIDIDNVTVDTPVVYMQKLPSGKGNWDFLTEVGAKPDTAEQATETEEQKDPGFEISLNNVEIEGGQLNYRDGKELTVVKDINVELSADTLSGPFAANGKLKYGEQSLKFEVSAGEIKDTQPIKVEGNVKYNGYKAELAGTFDTASTKFVGTVKANIDGNILKQAGAPISPNLNIAGNLQGSPSAIMIQNLNLTAGEVKATGFVKVNLEGSQPYEVKLNNLPGQTNVALTGSIEAGTTGHLQVKSQKIKGLLDWAKVNTAGIPADALGKVSLNTDFSVGEVIQLTRLALNMSNNNVSGSLKIAGDTYTVDLNTNTLGGWLALAGQKDINVSTPVRVKGPFTISGNDLKIDANVMITGGSIGAKGTIKKLTTSPAFNLNISISQPDANRLAKALGAGDLPIKLKQIKLASSITGNASKFNFSNLKGVINPGGTGMSINGNGSYDMTGKKPKLNMDLNLGDVALDPILAAANTDTQYKFILASAKQPSTSFKGWSSDPIDLSGLNALDANINVLASSMTYGEFRFDKVQLPIRINNGVLTMPNLQGGIFGGQAKGSLTVSPANMKANLNLSNASLQHLLGKDSAMNVSGGRLNSVLDIATTGKSQREIVSNLNGRFGLNISKGALEGMDFKGLADNLKNINNPVGILGLFKGFTSKGKTPFNSIAGNFTIQNGIAHTDNFTLDAKPTAFGTAFGSINLPEYSIDMKAKMTLTAVPKLPPFEMHVHGPLDNPDKDFNVANITTYIVQQFGGKAVGKLLGKDGIGGKLPIPLPIPIPGIGGDKEATPSEPSKGGVPKPAEAVKGLLKGLLK